MTDSIADLIAAGVVPGAGTPVADAVTPVESSPDSSTEVDNEDPTDELENTDPTLILPGDSWESVAARLGVHVDDLFAWNTGLGGCFSRDMVPVGQRIQNLDKIKEAETSTLNTANFAEAEANKSEVQRAAEAAVAQADAARRAYEQALADANEAIARTRQ